MSRLYIVRSVLSRCVHVCLMSCSRSVKFGDVIIILLLFVYEVLVVEQTVRCISCGTDIAMY